MNNLYHHRQHFPALANKAYFNYGGQGTMPQAAIEAITQAHATIQELGPFSNPVSSWIAQEYFATRGAIASELNVSPDTITLTEDVTVGCNIAMWGLNWQQGDHLLLSDCEHQGIVATAQEIARRFSVEVTTCPLLNTRNQGDPCAVIAQHLRPNTRLVAISHILWNTGQVLDIDKIAELCIENSSETRLLVDAAQSVGSLPLDFSNSRVDFYAFTGHKWLCSPAGIGGLYVRAAARESLRPTFIGWRGIITDSHGQPQDWQPDGRRYEVATSDVTLYPALREAIAIHNQWGSTKERYQQILQKSAYLWQKLMKLPEIECLRDSPPESGLVSFRLQNTSSTNQKLVQYLESQKIFTRTLANPNCIRACTHYFTLESEIDKLVETIQEFLGN
ncbi:aminotransferase class V-fold PLP-dependent enzyme [Calothrix sp. 336/3]|uniref:aminotransferase class V-fold PLP-dependent enzyme n=1 Tax=Calothrix sp. 336/3 TaxID=1337936 RepID=UPI0004E37B68|nr:aminotransferase class V-fold PLP-dependent enzyme [Calothrix sp. 336/3]AKG24314.1 cysteine lyase [Calothrix sp. 336/3]